jgi:hydrogenase maturation protease
MPDVRVICVHQLTPEVIDEMNNAARVIFLDASVLPADAAFDVSAVKPRQSRRQFGHFESAQSLLALLAELEGRVPEALLLSIRAASFEHGESLTETARKNLDEAMAWLRSYLVDQQCTKSA